jgi:hypothetical protein
MESGMELFNVFKIMPTNHREHSIVELGMEYYLHINTEKIAGAFSLKYAQDLMTAADRISSRDGNSDRKFNRILEREIEKSGSIPNFSEGNYIHNILNKVEHALYGPCPCCGQAETLVRPHMTYPEVRNILIEKSSPFESNTSSPENIGVKLSQNSTWWLRYRHSPSVLYNHEGISLDEMMQITQGVTKNQNQVCSECLPRVLRAVIADGVEQLAEFNREQQELDNQRRQTIEMKREILNYCVISSENFSNMEDFQIEVSRLRRIGYIIGGSALPDGVGGIHQVLYHPG